MSSFEVHSLLLLLLASMLYFNRSLDAFLTAQKMNSLSFGSIRESNILNTASCSLQWCNNFSLLAVNYSTYIADICILE